jgi:hypothetical protein
MPNDLRNQYVIKYHQPFFPCAARMNTELVRKGFWNINESLSHLELMLQPIKDSCRTKKFPK